MFENTNTLSFEGDMEDLGSLTSKILLVMRQVGYVEKTGENTHHNYSYLKEENLIEKIRKPLIEEGIMIFTSVEETDQDIRDDITRMLTEHAIVDTESGATLVLQGRGHGQSSQDTGPYVSMTGAVKYMWKRILMLSTGDDPEKEKWISGEEFKRMVKGAEQFGIGLDELKRLLKRELGITNVNRIHRSYKDDIRKIVMTHGDRPSPPSEEEQNQEEPEEDPD